VEDFIFIFCTVPTEEMGVIIAEDLVSGRYAACVNIVPGLMSVYSWKGSVCHDNEFLLIIKTRSPLFERVRDRIKALHTYEVPEIISCRISDGSESYLKWLAENTLSQ
jgi:periplasmic divalent cation tolerance protein